MSQWMPIIVSVVLAIIPVVIWLAILYRQDEEKGLYVKTFLFGTFSVVPPFVLIVLFKYFPQLDFYQSIADNIHSLGAAIVLTNLFVAIIEELGKNLILRIIDKRHPEYIQTLSSALKLSICAGLGFAFAENIFYFYHHFGDTIPELISLFIGRSFLTMCMHMVASGIFGYFFAIGKFSADITEMARWEGEKMAFVHFLSRITGKMAFQVVREVKNVTGLLIAMALHVTFNVCVDFSIQYNNSLFSLPPILVVILGALYVWYLLKTRSGHLLFSVVKRRSSTMASQDEEVVLELLGMWMKEGKLNEVVSICDRLLQRDPDNNVVKLFKAKAMDNSRLKELYTSLKAVFEKQKNAAKSKTVGANGAPQKALGLQDEKVVLELMDMWYKEGKYKEVLEIANRLLEKNPTSSGAKVLMEKALDQKKVEQLFDSLSKLFSEKE